jgi:hypothetical protein
MRLLYLFASSAVAHDLFRSSPNDILNVVGAIEESLAGPKPVEMIVYHSPMAEQIRHISTLFGVEGFDYLHWVILEEFEDILLGDLSDERLIEAHFNKLVTEPARSAFHARSDISSISLSQLKQAVVGVHIYNSRPFESKKDHLDVYDHIMNVGLRISGPLLASVTEDVYNSMYSAM